MLPRNFSSVVGWNQAHPMYSLQFVERGLSIWTFMQTWKRETFRRVAVAVLERFSNDAMREHSVLGSVVADVIGSASVVGISGGSHVLADIYFDYLVSGYDCNLVDYPSFDLRLLKRSLLMVSPSVFGTVTPFSETEFVITRLKGVENHNWMTSRSGHRRAIVIGELSMPSLLEVVSNIVVLWFSWWSTWRRLEERRLEARYK